MRTRILLLISALLMLGAIAATAQEARWTNHAGNGWYRTVGVDRNNAYKDGYNDGVWDRTHNKVFQYRPHHSADAPYMNAYKEGYRTGYGPTGRGNGAWGRDDHRRHNDHDADDRRRDWRDRDADDHGRDWRDRDRNRGPQPNANMGFNQGYQDGMRRGQNDRMTRHSYRPTQHDDWRNGTHGYVPMYGDRLTYQNDYRRGFEQGYQRGYNGR